MYVYAISSQQDSSLSLLLFKSQQDKIQITVLHFVRQSVSPPVRQAVSLSVCQSVSSLVCQSVSLSVRQSVSPSVRHSVILLYVLEQTKVTVRSS